MEENIRQTEPVDFRADRSGLVAKYQRFKDIYEELSRCEPRVVSLNDAATNLGNTTASQECTNTRQRLVFVSQQLQALLGLCGIYISRLAQAIGLEPRHLGDSPMVLSLSQQLLERSLSPDMAALETSADQHQETQSESSVFHRGYNFLGRVARASLPIQALMLLLLGAAALLPTVEEEWSCMVANNFAGSLEPMLRYPNGPPPI